MTRRSGGLKGLATFLGSGEHRFEQSLMTPDAPAGVQRLPPVRLVPGRFQPRRSVDADYLAELTDSVRRLGIIEPIAVRPAADGQYEILAGEMRWRAAQQAGLAEVPVIVHAVDDRTAATIALVENLQRRDLDPIEEAHALARLNAEFGLRNRELAELLSRSESAISRTLGLLALAPGVQALMQARRLDAGHAKVLLGLPAEAQLALATVAAEQGLSVRELERRKRLLSEGVPSRHAPPPDAEIGTLERHLARRLGATVKVRYSASKQRGRVEIDFRDLDGLRALLARLPETPDLPET